MVNFSITQYGMTLDESKYSIDLDTKTFTSEEYDLVLDFTALGRWTFKTGQGCTFKTGDYCTFKTYANCTFKTGKRCTFNTSCDCTFDTGECCTFDTGECCTFMLWYINTCKFKSYDSISIILDLGDNKHYILTKELINMIKVMNG